MKYFVLFLVLIGFVGIAYATHDPTYSHSMPFGLSDLPLKQIQSGISFNEIQCKQNLVLVQKYDGSPACVKPETKWKLIERGWITKPQTLQLKPVPVLDSNGDTITSLNYSMYGGILHYITMNNKTDSIIPEITPLSNTGEIALKIPRDLIDSKCRGEDHKYFVLLDGEEVAHDEPQTTKTHRTITIQFDKNSKELEIIGTFCTGVISEESLE